MISPEQNWTLSLRGKVEKDFFTYFPYRAIHKGMKGNTTAIVPIAATLFLVAGFLLYWLFSFLSSPMQGEITSFTECAKANYPIAETNPRTCTANGKTFMEKVATNTSDLIQVSSPQPGALITSPLTIVGQARGTWYFEASFPVILQDGNGTVLAQGPAQAKSDWMTTEFVLFQIELDFQLPTTDTGVLILKKDNPSGLPEHDASISIPVRFK